jgi:hypothetical protein
MNDHPLTVEVVRLQADRFGDAQAGGVTRGQDGAMLQAADALEEVENFLRTEDHGKFLRLLGRRDHLLERPLSFERNFIEEAEGGDGRTNRNGRQLPFVGEIDLIPADLFRSQFLGGLVEVARKQ